MGLLMGVCVRVLRDYIKVQIIIDLCNECARIHSRRRRPGDFSLLSWRYWPKRNTKIII